MDAKLTKFEICIAVSKRARQITTDKLIRGVPLDENPVQVASEEFAKGKFKVVRSQDCLK